MKKKIKSWRDLFDYYAVGIRHNDNNALDIDTLKKDLPKVGDKIKQIPTVTTYDFDFLHNNRIKPKKADPIDGIVTYVNKDHLYYTVEFIINGHKIHESYKLPEKTEGYTSNLEDEINSNIMEEGV